MKAFLLGLSIALGLGVANNTSLGAWRWVILAALAVGLSTLGVLTERWRARRRRARGAKRIASHQP